ncbi:MAG: hypothetical protein ACR2F8_04100 [Caulobacteraceae bacterium]
MGAASGVNGTLDVSIIGNGGVTALPAGATELIAAGTGANSQITVTLPAAPGRTTYLTALHITATGATTAGSVVATAYLAGSALTLSWVFAFAGNANTGATPLILAFSDAVSAGGPNAVIQVILPALGAGNNHAAVNVMGYQL